MELFELERFLGRLGVAFDEDVQLVEVRLSLDAVTVVWETSDGDVVTRHEQSRPVVWS